MYLLKPWKILAAPAVCLLFAAGSACTPEVEPPAGGDRDCTAENHCRLVDGAAECEPGYDWLDPDPASGDYRCTALADAAVLGDADIQSDADPGLDSAVTSDAARTDTVGSDSARMDAATADAGRPDMAAPDTATSDAARPDSGGSDTSAPDTSSPDTSPPDTWVTPCEHLCPAEGATRCQGGQQQTCVIDADRCRYWGTPITCDQGCLDAVSCDLCAHQCPTFGASCTGDVLDTCVYDQDGCRVLLQQPCQLGCEAGACRSCASIPDPMIGSLSTGQTGWYKDLVLHGDTAISNWQERDGIYTQQGTGLSAVGIGAPASMELLDNATYDPSNYITDLELVGDRLYFLVRQGMEIYDVSDPSAPAPVGFFPLHNDDAIKRDLSVDGDLACIAADDGLHLVDVSQDSAPVQRGVHVTDVWTSQVRCRGRYAAITPGYNLQIVDLLDPNTPLVAAELPTSNQSNMNDNMIFDGRSIFLWTYSPYGGSTVSQVDAYEFSAPDQLSKVGTMQTGMSATYTSLSGDQLFFSAGATAGAIDVADPTAMRWSERFWVPDDDPRGLVFDGDTLFVASDGVKAFDLELAPDVVLLETQGTDFLTGSAQLGSLALLARSNSGLVIQDLRDPTSPVELVTVDLPASDVKVRGHHAYVLGYDGSDVALKVYDISCPWEPVEIGSVRTPDSISQLSLSGNRAYAMCGIGRICVFDITSPTAPALLVQSDAILQTLGSASSSTPFKMDGSLLYLPQPDLLTVVDLSDIESPATIGTMALPGYLGPVRSAISGDVLTLVMPCFYIYGDNCYYTVDISDPTTPTELGSLVQYQTFGRGSCETLNSYPCINTLHVHGERGYLSHQWGGITLLDLSDPTDPQLITEYWTTMAARRMFVAGRFLTTYTETGFPQTGPYGQADQVFEMCQ